MEEDDADDPKPNDEIHNTNDPKANDASAKAHQRRPASHAGQTHCSRRPALHAGQTHCSPPASVLRHNPGKVRDRSCPDRLRRPPAARC